MGISKKWMFIITIMSFFAFSALGKNAVEPVYKENMAFSSMPRIVVLGVVGSAILDKALQSNGATSLPASAL